MLFADKVPFGATLDFGSFFNLNTKATRHSDDDASVGSWVNEMTKISLATLIEGGAEILAAINKNHQNVMLGNELNNPLNEITKMSNYYNNCPEDSNII
ncbi:hypothetical protein CDAR_575311 [Caerostris darwini]|uniref:Uncharacterized protein n=1 Tax=Caerostris darwini TaxID=1538125 RepID=A0AAV4SVQ1_9ARAC|nr:hypothetical protein CDAR_575311 [Caerostris darwini]